MDKFFRLTFSFLITLVLLGDFLKAEEIKTGAVVEKIICLEQTDQNYSLFLPKNYSRDKKWPIIYAFDPGARGKIPVERFKTAANKYGYIITGSNNARNGPTTIFIEALKAMWADTHKRFSIDESRIYSTGFSGGARMAVLVPHVIGRPISGIIACGAGLPNGIKPEHVSPATYYGIIGLCDMNYKEMIRLDKILENSEVEHHILIINSPHQWPDTENLTRAVEWMEISAIKKGIRNNEALLVKSLFFKSHKYALESEEQGHLYLAARAYESICILFKNLVDITAIKNRLVSLKESSVYKENLKQELQRQKKELEFIERFNWILSGAEKQSMDQHLLENVLKDLQVKILLKEKKDKKNPLDFCWAERLLVELKYKVMDKGQLYYNKRDFNKSIFFTTLLTRIFKDNSNAHYYLACLYSLTGQKKKALHNLKKAVEKGFANLEMINKDDDLNTIRKEKVFQELLLKIKSGN